MKVVELIARLSQCDADIDVVVPGYEDGFNDVRRVSQFAVACNVGESWYNGDHMRVEDHTEYPDEYPGAMVKRVVCIA